MTMLMHHMLRAAAGAGAAPPVATDPQFPYVSMLLNDTGTNGAQNNTFLDSSSNNFTITRNGTPTQGSVTPYWPDGQWSNFFNSTTVDYLGVPSNAALNPSNGAFTFETWFYPLTFTQGSLGGDTLLIVETTNGVQIGKREAPGGNVWGLCANGIAWRLTTSTQPTNNAWNHIVIVRAGTGTNQTAIFLNGTRVAVGTVTDTFAQGAAYVGGGTSTGAQKINGYLSNLRFVKGTAVYDPTQTTLTVPATPLTAVSGTSLLTCQSNRFKDNSSNNFAVTVTGTPTVQAFEPFEPASSYATSVGGSGYFGGSASINTPTSAAVLGTNNWTFEGWVYLNAKPSFGQVIGMRRGVASSADQYCPVLIAVNTTGFLFYSSGNSTSWDIVNGVAFGGTAAVNQWYHIAVVRNGTTITGYVNGVATTLATGVSPNYTSTNNVFVAGGLTSDYTNCYASNVRVVNGTAVYTAAFTPPTSPVTAITGTSLLLNFTNAGIYDAAVQNDLVTVGDAKVSTAQAKFGSSSMAFDGSGDWLTFVDSPTGQLGTGDFTIEGWLYLPLLGTARGIVSKGTSTTGWSVGVNALNQFTFSYTSSTLTATTALTMGQWVHFAVVRNGSATGNVKIYFNGVLDATSGGAVTDNFNQTSIGYVGADRVGTSPMNGYIDDLRITKGYARYTANFTPPTAAFPTR